MKNYYYAFIAFILIVISSSLKAQNSVILKGIVSDAVSKELIIGAVVYNVSDKEHGVVSDINGNYQLPLKAGRDTIVCTIISMQPDTFIVTDPSKDNTHDFRLRSGSQQMETYVVSAGKYERKLEEITVSMEVLKPSLIENKNSSNITDALEQVPGLNILDGEPQIRGGSGFDFGVGSRVAVLIDGLPAMTGDGSALAWEFIPVENVEQVEVIKGASSVTYGSSALSGSINVRTAYAKDQPVTMISFSSGFYDKPSVPVPGWLSGPANFSDLSFLHSEKFGQLDLVFGGMIKYDQGYIGPSLYSKSSISSFVDTSIKSNQVGEKTGRFNFNLRYRPKNAPKINFGVNGNFMESHNNTTLTWQNDSTGLYRAFPHTLVLKEQDILYVDPYINYISSNGWSHSFRTRWSYTNNKQTNENYASDTATPNVTTLTNTIYSEYQVTKQVNDDLNFTGGLFMNQTYSYNELPFPGVLQTNHLQNYAGFLQIDKKLWKRLNLSVGYREESFKMNSEKNTLIPILRAGANLRIGKATYLRASWGQGYRFPSITEKYIFSNVGPMSIYPNPNLRAETSTNAEIGIKQEFKINNFIGAIDLAAFQQEYNNTIEITYAFWAKYFVPPGATPTGFKYVNTGNTQIRGLEVSLPGEGKISKDLKIDVLAGYTYIIPVALQPTLAYATDSLNRPLSYVVHTSTDTKNNILKYRMQTIAKVDLQLTYKKYFIGGDWKYYSFMQNIDTVFYLFDLQAGYGVQQYRDKHDKGINVFDARIGMQATKRIKVAFVVDNLTNLSYSLRPLKIESPRTFAIRFTYKID